MEGLTVIACIVDSKGNIRDQIRKEFPSILRIWTNREVSDIDFRVEKVKYGCTSRKQEHGSSFWVLERVSEEEIILVPFQSEPGVRDYKIENPRIISEIFKNGFIRGKHMAVLYMQIEIRGEKLSLLVRYGCLPKEAPCFVPHGESLLFAPIYLPKPNKKRKLENNDNNNSEIINNYEIAFNTIPNEESLLFPNENSNSPFPMQDFLQESSEYIPNYEEQLNEWLREKHFNKAICDVIKTEASDIRSLYFLKEENLSGLKAADRKLVMSEINKLSLIM